MRGDTEQALSLIHIYPAVFLPQEPTPFDQDSLPLGLVKKFVPDTGLNDRIIDVVSWWSARKNRVLALNFHGFDGVLETVRNLYHMLPLYARKRFGFITYAPDPQERLRCAPGCSILCIQQKDKDLSLIHIWPRIRTS